jgi:hypothetical protein
MATIPRGLLSRTNESASPVCPFMALSGLTRWRAEGQLLTQSRHTGNNFLGVATAVASSSVARLGEKETARSSSVLGPRLSVGTRRE